MSTQAFDVFLSYHSEDRALAQQVYESLTDGQALRVWWDAKSIPPGELWVRAIDDGFSRARVFVVLLSDRAPRRWVEAEVSRALHCYFSELPGPRHILPVLIGDQPLHGVPNALSGFLSVFQAAQPSASAEQFTADGLSELGAAVRRLLGEPEATPKAAPAQPLVTEPFLGLASFDERHSHLFFGRRDETAVLVSKLEQPGCRWLQVDGASGTGKSSLVKAGLLPALARRPSRPGQPDWLTLVMRPGTNPIKALADALLELDAGQNLDRHREPPVPQRAGPDQRTAAVEQGPPVHAAALGTAGRRPVRGAVRLGPARRRVVPRPIHSPGAGRARRPRWPVSAGLDDS